MESFSEMLGGSTTCSIPYLDLPPQFHSNHETGAGFIGYSEIFSGFSEEEFAVNYQELISGSSNTSNGRVQMEAETFLSLSTEGAEICIPDIISNDLIENAAYNAPFDDVREEVTPSPSSTENSNTEGFYAKHVPVDYSGENVTNHDVTYTTVSGINLQTQPSIVPPPTKTPPKIVSKHNGTKFDIVRTSKVDTGAGSIKQSWNQQIQYKVGDSNCGNYRELDAWSAVAAMKEAMEQAQARLKYAKEMMERKKGNIQSQKRLGHKGNTKDDEWKELKTSEDGKLLDVEDERCVVKGAESQLTGQNVRSESSQTNYELEEYSKEQKFEELSSELVGNDGSRLVKELSKQADIENKLKTSSDVNEAKEIDAYKSHSKAGNATYIEETNVFLDVGNKNQIKKEIEQENNCSSKTLSSGEDLINRSASEEIPCTDNLTKLEPLDVEPFHVKSLDSVLIFEENFQDGITHAAKTDFNKSRVGMHESCNEKRVQKNNVASDVNGLIDNFEEFRPELESEKTIEREHEKEQAIEAEEEEFKREGEKDEPVTESAHAKAWERAKRVKNEARQNESSKAREIKMKAETLERLKIEKALKEAKLRAERAAAQRATAEARERAVEKALDDAKLREEKIRKKSWGKKKKDNAADVYLQTIASSSVMQGVAYDAEFQNVEVSTSSKRFSNSTFDADPPLECKGTVERHPTTDEHAKVLAEKSLHDVLTRREQEDRNKFAESLDADINRWSRGKEGNLRALLSALQFILGPDSGWQPILVTDLISAESLKRAYRKATLCVHPDKLQQRGASVRQKYICEKVFDLLQEAWNRFNLNE